MPGDDGPCLPRMKDLTVRLSVLTFMFVLFSAGAPINMAKAESIDIYEQQKLTSHLLIDLFLDQIAKDGLTVFDHVLNKSDLHSHHVAYIHNTASDTLKVQLCFTLAKRITVPDFDSFFVDRITVEMDKDGNIVEVLTHVSPVEQEQEKSD